LNNFELISSSFFDIWIPCDHVMDAVLLPPLYISFITEINRQINGMKHLMEAGSVTLQYSGCWFTHQYRWCKANLTFKTAHGHAQNDRQNGRTAIKSTEQLYVDGIFDARIFLWGCYPWLRVLSGAQRMNKA
jgi:hypothetical protein